MARNPSGIPASRVWCLQKSKMDINIETYRSRIGSFNNRSQYKNNSSKSDSKSNSSRKNSFSIILFAILFSTVLLQHTPTLQFPDQTYSSEDNLFNTTATSSPPVSVWVIGGHSSACSLLHRCFNDLTCLHSAATQGCAQQTCKEMESFKILAALPIQISIL